MNFDSYNDDYFIHNDVINHNVWCITGEKDVSRHKYIREQFKDVNFHYYTQMEDKTKSCADAHIGVCRKLLESDEKQALVIEDDVVAHVDFSDKLFEIYTEIPKRTPVVLLGYICRFSDTKQVTAHLHSTTRNIVGAQAYVISRAFAMSAIRWYETLPSDCVFGSFDNNCISSEVPIILSLAKGGLFAKPMLFVENLLLPSIRDPSKPEKNDIRNYWFTHYTDSFDVFTKKEERVYSLIFGEYSDASLVYFKHTSLPLYNYLKKFTASRIFVPETELSLVNKYEGAILSAIEQRKYNIIVADLRGFTLLDVTLFVLTTVVVNMQTGKSMLFIEYENTKQLIDVLKDLMKISFFNASCIVIAR